VNNEVSRPRVFSGDFRPSALRLHEASATNESKPRE